MVTPIIGLEVHVELATKSKMFCGCPADPFSKLPNTQTCPVCLGLPGALPVPNKKAVEWTILLGLALGCKINIESKFDRKHYFYPDLPKGYQITQYDQPLCVRGHLYLHKTTSREGKIIRIRRVHLEEDTGKLQHEGEMTLVDFNRSGVPLVEIVTEPDFRSVEEVDIFLKKLQRIIRYLGISSADMEKGSMRLEPSISLSLNGKLPNYRVELKNINSFRFVRKALEYEISRQQKEPHIQQTRGWNETKGETVPQRGKEEAHDYRYFPDPDIPPMVFNRQLVSTIQKQVPELPDAKKTRFIKEYKISNSVAEILTESRKLADEFEEKIKKEKKFNPVDIANAVVNKRPLVTVGSQDVPVEIVAQVINQNPKAVADYKSGNLGALGPLIGAVLKRGNFDKQLVIAKIKEKLL